MIMLITCLKRYELREFSDGKFTYVLKESEKDTEPVHWTLRLLENKVVELNFVDRASDSTIGRTLKKTFSSRI